MMEYGWALGKAPMNTHTMPLWLSCRCLHQSSIWYQGLQCSTGGVCGKLCVSKCTSSYKPHEQGGPKREGNWRQGICPQHDDRTFALACSKQLRDCACHITQLPLINPFSINTQIIIELCFRCISIPMFMAGGSAYCNRRTNWYKGSGFTRPSWTAPLTMAMPNRGRNIYRTTMIPIRSEARIPEPFKPEIEKHHHGIPWILYFANMR